MERQREWEQMIREDFEKEIAGKTLPEIKVITYDVIHSLWNVMGECELMEGLKQRKAKRNETVK